MFRRMALIVVAAAALGIVTGAAYAAEKSHEGKVVSVAEGNLKMTDNDGKNEHSHDIAAKTKITLDGKEAKLADLNAGDKIKVTQDEAGKVTAVAATRAKNNERRVTEASAETCWSSSNHAGRPAITTRRWAYDGRTKT